MSQEITIIGAGIIGLVTAFELTERGKTVRLIDAGTSDYSTAPDGTPLYPAASHYAGGMLAPIAEVQFQQDALFPLMTASADAYPSLMEQLSRATDLPTGYDTTGTLIVAADRADAEHLERTRTYYQDLNRPTSPITPSQARALEPLLAPRIAGAVSIPSDHQLYPRLMVRALKDALVRRGVTFSTERVTDPDAGDIICTGLGATLLGEYPLRPVYGDILRLRTPRPLLKHVVRGYVNSRPVYLIPRPDGELCIGATSREDQRTLPAIDGVHQLLRDAIRLVPAIEECELLEANVGARPGTPDDLPIFGHRTRADGTRQLVSTGYFRHGILLAALAGKIGAEVACGADIPPAMKACDPARFEA